MVVSLNDSDDSDSDVDACSSSQAVFGGLEFMIKEARRTVEVSMLSFAGSSWFFFSLQQIDYVHRKISTD